VPFVEVPVGRVQVFAILASPGSFADSYSTIIELASSQTMPANPESDSDQSYQDALSFLYKRINYERIVAARGRYKFRLRRITALLQQLGLSRMLYSDGASDPGIPLVHIAGTKGKGSTAAMVSAALTASGLRTGLYTSPHLHRLEERFRIDSVPCEQDELVDLVGRVAVVTKSVESELGPLSFFELTTALALLHFDNSVCDAIVLEVGLGGRLDSTNVCAPSVSVVTSIGLDHQHVLGNTLTEIATEKAGIIKTNVPVVSGVIDVEAASVVRKIATEKECDLFQIGDDFDYRSSPEANWGTKLEFEGRRLPMSSRFCASLQMEGDHQAHNAALAIASLDLLRDQGMTIPEASVQSGLQDLCCIGRIERFELAAGVTGIVDAAHNQDSIAALCNTLRGRAGDGPIAIVFGTSIDKDAAVMLTALAEVTSQIVLTRFWGNPRYYPTTELLRQLPDSMRATATVIENPIDACNAALGLVSPGGTLIVCGSFFLAAETRDWFRVS